MQRRNNKGNLEKLRLHAISMITNRPTLYYMSRYVYSICGHWPKCHRYMEDYGKYPIFPDIWEIKRMRKQFVPGVPPLPRMPGYEAETMLTSSECDARAQQAPSN